MDYRLEIDVMKPSYRVDILPNGKPKFEMGYIVFDKKVWDFQGDVKIKESDRVDLSDVDEELGSLTISDVIKMPNGYKLLTYKTIKLGDIDINEKLKAEESYEKLLNEYNQLGWWGRLWRRLISQEM